MALVAYENSESSDYEEEDHEEPAITAILITKDEGESSEAKPANEVTNPAEDQQSLFNLLPQPSSYKPEVVEEDDEFLHKKAPVPNIVKPKARITVPSLSDFKDVDSMPNKKQRTPSTKTSGLLSLLPQPKGSVILTTTSKSLIPHVLTRKPTNTVKKKPLPTPAKQLKVSETNSLALDYSDDSDNNDEVHNDFFSINKPIELPTDDIPLDIDDKLDPKADKVQNESLPKEKRNIESYFKQNVVESHVEQSDSQMISRQGGYGSEDGDYSNGYNGASESSSTNSNDVVLDEEALRRLCGARGKHRREDIQLLDIDQSAVLAEARQSYMRGLLEDTSKRASASKRKGNEPTSQQKRKHQITYLAHQAKANEQELQNQWSQNRMSKRQTQSKYGF